MKCRKTWKGITAIMLCMVLALTGLNVQVASAASGKVPLKVTFKGKTAAFVKDLNKVSKYPTVKSLTSKWGKPKKSAVQYNAEEAWKYTWKKGKTEISLMTDTKDEKAEIRFGKVDIRDKNGALCGVKVGMKKDTAVKKLKKVLKALGLKNEDMSIDDDRISISWFTLTTTTEYNAGGFEFELKNGKVSSCFWTCSPSSPLNV